MLASIEVPGYHCAHNKHQAEKKKDDIKDVQNDPVPDWEPHLSHLIDDIVNNILQLQLDDHICEAILKLLPQLLLLFAMRVRYQMKNLIKVSKWLIIQKNRR